MTFRRGGAATLLLLAMLTLLPAKSISGDSLRFFVLGDWGREGSGGQQQVASTMVTLAADSSVDFTVSTGDNFYQNGVDGVEDDDWQESFEEVYSAPSLQHPWYAVLGNHDWRGDWHAQLEYSRLSDRWTMPDRHYVISLTAGDSSRIDLFFVDTNVITYRSLDEDLGPVPDGRSQSEFEVAWLDSALGASDAEWKVVVGHHPLYSSSGHHGPSLEVREALEPLLARYNVIAYFNGHEHDLQHQDPGTGTHYFTSGAGSSTRRAGVNEWTRLAWGRTPGVVLVTVDDGSFRVEAFDSRRNRLYSVTLDREGEVAAGGEQRAFRGRWFPPW